MFYGLCSVEPENFEMFCIHGSAAQPHQTLSTLEMKKRVSGAQVVEDKISIKK